MAIRTQPPTAVPAPTVDARSQLKAAARAKLSGAVTEGAECNPVDLSVDPFSRVSYFDFEPESNLTVVEFSKVADDAEDW